MSRHAQRPQNEVPDDRIVRADGADIRVAGEPAGVAPWLCQLTRLSGTEPRQRTATGADPDEDRDRITLSRLRGALDDLDIQYLVDGEGSFLAVWERHAMLFTVEGPADEILVIRARVHATVVPERADHAYRTVNEWNRTHRFGKAYLGDPLRSGQLPVYTELQVSLEAGLAEALLVELLECGAAVATSFVDWLHGEAGLL